MPTIIAKLLPKPSRVQRQVSKYRTLSASKYSRKDYTQHQLFALLALKTFFKTDYRGVIHVLTDFAELRQDLGLAAPPHYSTLCYAAKRLLKKGSSSCSSTASPRAHNRAV